ncbi:MAG: hypothetical protein Q7U63_19245 [Polaromonas sp.]|uniref:hypothetical protein n=1 Tax=Polaromonas sp. TaxID=1869339 RepID=UPI002724D9D7|nr:hypothetical protein [Polaromonas sp.]MDO9115919.1 hypothetical protein [Polaromonas sp.]MDP1888564.1 hypothetical protein [Polaromonas sp.]
MSFRIFDNRFAPAGLFLAALALPLAGQAASPSAAEQRLADKLRQGEWLEHIDAHDRLSPETARALIHWLVEGAK